MGEKVIWLGFAVPDHLAQELYEIDPLPQVQTQRFGWSFARSLRYGFGGVVLASSCPVQSYPIVRRIFFLGKSFEFDGVCGVTIGFLNISLLKQITRFLSCFFSVTRMILVLRPRYVFIHGVHTPYLLYGLFARFARLKVCAVLTDSPGIVLKSDGSFSRLLKRFDGWLVRRMLRHFDFIVSLAPDLVQSLAPSRPALVLPGVLDSSFAHVLNRISNTYQRKTRGRSFTVVYAGGLMEEYGVDLLIDAVLSFDLSVPVSLKLFGRGDREERIKALSIVDSRIVYGGFLDSESLAREFLGADVLINPRPSNELFSRLSFPSKLIEYLLVGCPVLTTRIKSIPPPLMHCYHYIEDESPAGIRVALESLMRIPVQERISQAAAARKFVESNYSEQSIGFALSNFVRQLEG